MQFMTYALASVALAIAAAEISARAKALKSDGQGGGRPLILLGQSEVLDFGVVGSMTAEIESLTDQLTPLLPKPPVGRLMPPVAGFIAGISAVAGLFRSETVVSPADFTQIDDAMLVRAIAKNMKDVAIIPSAAIASPPHVAGRDDLLGKLKKATELSFRIRQERDALAAIDKPNAAQTARLSDMEAVLKRFDAFYTRVTTADANGAVPIAAAARLESIQGQAGNVLRVHVDRGGGTLTNSKNIATIFGDDPVRISGALVASYTVTDPQNGSILGGGVINCRTAVARLRNVQEGHFLVRDQAGVRTRVKGDAPRAICAIE